MYKYIINQNNSTTCIGFILVSQQKEKSNCSSNCILRHFCFGHLALNIKFRHLRFSLLLNSLHLTKIWHSVSFVIFMVKITVFMRRENKF